MGRKAFTQVVAKLPPLIALQIGRALLREAIIELLGRGAKADGGVRMDTPPTLDDIIADAKQTADKARRDSAYRTLLGTFRPQMEREARRWPSLDRDDVASLSSESMMLAVRGYIADRGAFEALLARILRRQLHEHWRGTQRVRAGNRGQRPTSLNEPETDTGETLASILPAPAAAGPDHTREEAKAIWDRAARDAGLTPNEKRAMVGAIHGHTSIALGHRLRLAGRPRSAKQIDWLLYRARCKLRRWREREGIGASRNA